MSKRLVSTGFFGILLFVLAVQALPYGRDHTNPPVGTEPRWDNPQTRELTVRACFDCHSNETLWPWYSNVAPMSWLIQRDVDKGRRELNFSEWGRQQRQAREAAETVQEDKMPPFYYVPLHPAAALSAAERQALVQGLAATLGGSPGGGGESSGREREH